MIYIFLIILLLLFAQVLGISIAFAHTITKPKKPTMQESMAREKERGHWKDFDSYPKKEWNIKGYGDYLLHGELLLNPGKKFVIITHGYTDSRYGALKYAHIYYKLGYQVYIYDIRYHGMNEGGHCSMGYYESKDILAIADAIWSTYGDDCTIGLHGESLGSASSILALGSQQKFAFLVSDCGFSDLRELMRYQANVRFHLPKFLAATSSFVNFLIHRYHFFKICPKKALVNNEVPVLFMHGKKDDFIPSTMCEDMFEMTKAEKKIVLFENADHAMSYMSAPEKYESCIHDFLYEIHQIVEK